MGSQNYKYKQALEKNRMSISFKTKLFCYLVTFLFYGSSSAWAEPTLSLFIKEILKENPAIQAAQANVAAASARENAASQYIYNPELTAQKQDGLEEQISIGINQTIDWAGKRGARQQVGIANALVAQTQLTVARQRTASQVLNLLSTYQTKQKSVILVKKRVSLLQKSVAIAQERYKNGDIARIDLDLAQLALAEALAPKADTEISANKALQALRAISGFNKTNLPDFPDKLPKLPVKNKDVDSIVNKLPILLVLEHQYQSALARIKLAERERYPDPTIGIQGGKSSDDEKHKRLIGVSVSIPLYVLNPYRAEVEAAGYDSIEAQKNRDNILRQARAEIIGSLEQYQILYEAFQEWQKISEKPLSDGVDLIQRLWKAGEISTTDYLIQLKQLIDSQIAGVELKGRAWQSWVELLNASGQVDHWLQLS